jgi:hypothetical protein
VPTVVTADYQVAAAVATVRNRFGVLHFGFQRCGGTQLGAIVDLDEKAWVFTIRSGPDGRVPLHQT